jgi:putative radical SAM enzyme (TIGR03279 family)
MDDRADYGRENPYALGAFVKDVEDESPAWAVGIEPGMQILSVNGKPLNDMIDWLWETADETVDLEVLDPSDGSVTPVTLERDLDETFGITFTDAIFDGIRTCKNACVFCFMSMLPDDMRATLYVRDDDYRLSFLQGNFVTLTNVDEADSRRIRDMQLSPMNVSLHAISPDVRRKMMGKFAYRGIEVLEELMDAGIEIHAQIVLCPGINDGEEFVKTLDYVEAHPEITSLAVVPMGYTKHTKRFDWSFSDDPAASLAVVEAIGAYQKRNRERYGIARFYLSDEFYVDAGVEVPPADDYDGFPQYYDGIGMLRVFLDDTDALVEDEAEALTELAGELADKNLELLVVSGEAALPVYENWIEKTGLPGAAFAVRNDFFGGDVNVTGLITAEDLLAQLPSDLSGRLVVLPDLMLNADSKSLDGSTDTQIVEALEARGARAAFMTTTADEMFAQIKNFLHDGAI